MLKKKNLSSLFGWLGFGLVVLIVLFLSNLAGMKLSFWTRDEAAFALLLVYFAPLPLILGLALFLFSKIKKKIKILSILIITPFLLRIIFAFYYFPQPLVNLFKFHAQRIEKVAIETKDPELCLKIGRIFPFADFIFPPRVASFSIAPLQKNCVVAVALAAKNESFCDVLTSKKMAYPPFRIGYKNSCYIEVAKLKKDFSICEKLDPGSLPDFNMCYQEVLVVSENICQDSSSRDECIKNIAIERKNIHFCKGVWNPKIRTECEREVQIITGELAPCKGLELEKKKECIKNIAVEKDAVNLCSLISHEYWDHYAEECYKEIIFSGRRNSLEECEKFSGLEKRVCKFEVAVNKDDISICKGAGSYSTTEWCYTGIAIKRKDPQICYEIEADYPSLDKNDCLMDLAIKMDNLDVCQDLEYEYMVEDCVSKIAIQRNDEKLCKTLSRKDSKRNCLMGIAIKRGDIEMCKMIPDDPYRVISYKDSCIKSIAKKKNDPKICEYIEGKEAKNLCYKEFGIIK